MTDNARVNAALAEQLRQRVASAALGGPESVRTRHTARGKLLPRDRVYRLLDPEQYRGQSVLVVGGGDSALEAAASIAELPETKVALSYRGEAFDRAKAKNRERVASANRSGKLHLLLGSQLQKIGSESVVMDLRGKALEMSNDAVIVSAGGILPTEFLKSVGIEVATKYGTR